MRPKPVHNRPPRPSRRTFLKWMGASALAAPLLSRIPAFADGAGAPTRLILFPSLNGSQHFFPNAGNVSEMSLVTEPLAAFQSQMQFVRGIGIAGSQNHFAVRSMFTGAPISDYSSPDPSVASVDQVVASHIHGTAPRPIRSLHLGAIPADAIEFYQLYGRSTFFFSPVAVDYEANPVTAFDTVFGDLPTGEPPPDPPMGGPTDRSDAYHDLALGITRAELGDLAGRTADLPEQRAKIDGHLAALAGLDRDTSSGGGGGTTLPPAMVSCDGSPLASVEALRPALGGNARAAYEHQHYANIIDAQIDIIARAVTCGLTRVATLQCGSADGNVTVPIEGGLPHHNTSHGDQLQFSRVQAWYASKFARLLTALDVTDPLCPEGNTVLHNSLVVWLSECMPSNHDSLEVPCMYAGSAGGRLVTGGMTQATGASNLHLLKTIAHVFGASGADTGHFAAQPMTELLA